MKVAPGSLSLNCAAITVRTTGKTQKGLGPTSIHQVSDGIKHAMYSQMVNVIHHILEERMGHKVHCKQNGIAFSLDE